MKHRKLRIAWSVAWGIATVFFIVQWVRSYRTTELIVRLDPGNKVTTIGSNCGVVYFAKTTLRPTSLGPAQPPPTPHWWQYQSVAAERNGHTSFAWKSGPTFSILYIPYWFFVVISSAIGSLAWLSARFSLRTLLVATTIIALGLGAVMWVAR
jgi:hypothetical protein